MNKQSSDNIEESLDKLSAMVELRARRALSQAEADDNEYEIYLLLQDEEE